MSENKAGDASAIADTATGPGKSHTRFLGTLRDALAAAGRDETLDPSKRASSSDAPSTAGQSSAAAPLPDQTVRSVTPEPAATASQKPADTVGTPRSAMAAKEPAANTGSVSASRARQAPPPPAADLRPGLTKTDADAPRTQLIRGKHKVVRSNFHQDPVVAWLVVIGGPGLGAYRPVFEGNNTVGRTSSQRIPIDFGDETISAEEQAYIRYDSADRKYLFVPNLAKTNVVQINDSKPTAAVELAAMDVITMGHTQLVFVPFCGEEFDWSELAGLKE